MSKKMFIYKKLYINKEVDRLNLLIEDLLMIAKMERYEETDNEITLINQEILPVII